MPGLGAQGAGPAGRGRGAAGGGRVPPADAYPDTVVAAPLAALGPVSLEPVSRANGRRTAATRETATSKLARREALENLDRPRRFRGAPAAPFGPRPASRHAPIRSNHEISAAAAGSLW